MFKVLVASLLFHSALSGSLVDVLKGDGETDLVDFIKQAGLADALDGGPFTVFAPTNAAFSKLPQATLNTLNTDFNALANILKYHVVQGNIHKADAKNELTLTTLAGTKIRFNIYPHNNVVTVEGSKITNFDLNADNGVVHVIDTVMTPPSGSIVDIVAGNSDFSELLKLVKETGLVSALQGSGVMVNNAHVTQADISATNGVVHVIDYVLFPTRHLFSILG
ncbi:hypothetical protein FSP39_004037 [Pinctada imbricata]|uniref:FAS1 domain-containing protein n=1 Tax=Pinctada imbricata TaxID=66713 RepID=A0AA89BUH0_PINIB|nr:hypothetical protein FSP39_004037 [Pinctada imbricata]